MKLDESVSIEENLLADLEEETTIPGFCHSLCDKVPVSELCSAFVPLVDVITENPSEPNADTSKYCDKSKMTKAQVIELERTVIDFMLDHFASKPFLNALLNLKTAQIRAMQPIYLSLFKRALVYAQQCANKAVRSLPCMTVPCLHLANFLFRRTNLWARRARRRRPKWSCGPTKPRARTRSFVCSTPSCQPRCSSRPYRTCWCILMLRYALTSCPGRTRYLSVCLMNRCANVR